MNSLIKKLTQSLVLVSAVAFSTTSFAVTVPADVMGSFQAGMRGDADANLKAIEQLGALSKTAPTDAIVMSLLGSSETTQARYTDTPWEKLQFAEKGLSKLDKALQLLSAQKDASPRDTLMVNTTVGCTFVKVPKMFNRFDEGYDILNNTVSSKAFSYMPPANQVSTYLCAAHAATTAKDKESAKRYFTAITAIAPQGPHMAQVEQLKAQLEE